MKIVLLGYMGAGKTTVSRALQQLLQGKGLRVKRHGIDEMVEKQAGCRIATLFLRGEESRFRNIETQCLQQAMCAEKSVSIDLVDCGGGIVISPENRLLIAAADAVIWLDVPPDIAWQRVALTDERPLVQAGFAAFYRRYAAREPHYKALATSKVDATAPPEVVAQWIVDQCIEPYCTELLE